MKLRSQSAKKKQTQDTFNTNKDIQEDYDEGNHFLFSTKQETETKPDVNLLASLEELRSKKSGNKHCFVCKKDITRPYFLAHLRSVHRVQPKLHRRNPKIQPDPKDPNHYCRSCDFTYASSGSYSSHLVQVHRYPRTNGWVQVAFPDLRPDINDQNNYCCTCDKSFSNRKCYTSHLRSVHGIQRELPVANPDIEPIINDANCFCRSCNLFYANKKSYSNHIRNTHGIYAREIARQNKSGP